MMITTHEIEDSRLPNKVLRLTGKQWRQARHGLLLGLLLGLELTLLGAYSLIDLSDVFVVTGIVGALLGLTKARKLLTAAAIAITVLMSIVAYTPLSARLVARWNRADTLPPGWTAPAVVVLSSHVQLGQTLDVYAQERIMRGYEILRRREAPRLVLTDADQEYGPQAGIVAAQMRTLDFAYPMEHVGPVHNTHDEALAVARLAKQRGWTTLILVTHPWHMRRAAAVFERAGLHVVGAACVEGSYDVGALTSPWPRILAFRDWLHEVVGYGMYRLRGWI